MPGVDRGRPHGIGQVPAVGPGEQREADRRERRPERGRAERVERLLEQLGHDAERQHAGGAALVVGGPDRREALDVLGRAQAGGRGAADVGDRRVALLVDEAVVLAAARGRRDRPQQRRGLRRRCDGAVRRPGAGRGRARGGALRDARVVVVGAGHRAGDVPAVRHGVGDEPARARVPAHAALRLAEQVDDRAPATGHEQQVAVDRAVADHRGGDAPLALGGAHDRAGQVLGAVGHRTVPVARVDDRRELQPGGGERGGGVVAGVVRRQQHRARPGEHAEALEVLARGAGEHHAREVVARERDRPLVRAGRQHHLPRPHVPQPLARDAGRRLAGLVVGAALGEHDVSGVVGADRGGAQQHPRLGGDRQPRARRPHRAAVAGRPRPQLRRRLGEHHPRAGRARGVGGGEPGRAAADHEHVAVRVHAVVRRAVAPAERAAPGQPARDEPVEQLDLGRAQHRLRPTAELDLHEPVGLLRAGRRDPARPAAVDARPDHVDAVRQQRRGERVAAEPAQRGAVERERERRAPVDAPEPVDAPHGARSPIR